MLLLLQWPNEMWEVETRTVGTNFCNFTNIEKIFDEENTTAFEEVPSHLPLFIVAALYYSTKNQAPRFYLGIVKTEQDSWKEIWIKATEKRSRYFEKTVSTATASYSCQKFQNHWEIRFFFIKANKASSSMKDSSRTNCTTKVHGKKLLKDLDKIAIAFDNKGFKTIKSHVPTKHLLRKCSVRRVGKRRRRFKAKTVAKMESNSTSPENFLFVERKLLESTQHLAESDSKGKLFSEYLKATVQFVKETSKCKL
jgi:hypothetical protein